MFRAIWSDDGLGRSCDASRAAYATWLNGFQLKTLAVPEDGTTTRSCGRAAWTEFEIEMSATAGRDRDAGIREAYRGDFRERFAGGHGVAHRNTTLRSWNEDGPAGTRRWTWVDTHADGAGHLGWATWEAPSLVTELLKNAESPAVDGHTLSPGPRRYPGAEGGLVVAELINRGGRTLPVVVVHQGADAQTSDVEPDPAELNCARVLADRTAGIAAVFAIDSAGARAIEGALRIGSRLGDGAIRVYQGNATGEPSGATGFKDFPPPEYGPQLTALDVSRVLASASTRRRPPASAAELDRICPPPRSNF